MKTHKEIYTELQNTDIIIRKQVLKQALALSMEQKLELCALFEMTTSPCNSVNIANEVYVLDGWSDAMITFYFQTFNDYFRGLEEQGILLNLEMVQTHDSDGYDGPDIEQDCFNELDWGECSWLESELHDHPTLQITCIGTRLVQCLIEDSSCLAWLLGVYLLNCVDCTFQTLDCRYLEPHLSVDEEGPNIFFENCSFDSIVNLECIYSSVTFGLTNSTVKAPLKIPKSKGTRIFFGDFIDILSLTNYVDLVVEQRKFGVLSLLGDEKKDYSWLQGAEIIDLVVSWRTLHILWPSIKDNPPKIKVLSIVKDNNVQMYSNTLSELPVGIEKCGIETLLSDSALLDFEDTPEGIQALMEMYAQLPNLKNVSFPFALEQSSVPTNGVWVVGCFTWPEEDYLCHCPWEAPAMCGETSLTWNGLGLLSWREYLSCLKTGLSLDLEATKKQLTTASMNKGV